MSRVRNSTRKLADPRPGSAWVLDWLAAGPDPDPAWEQLRLELLAAEARKRAAL